VFAYFALNEYRLMPWEFAALPLRRKAALIGMIKVRIEKEKKAQQQSKARRAPKRGSP
jgi:hypothetical protein